MCALRHGVLHVQKDSSLAQSCTNTDDADVSKVMRKYQPEARFRILDGKVALFVAAIAFSMSCFHMYTAGFGLLEAHMHGAVHLAFALSLTFLLYPAKRSEETQTIIPWYDYGCAAAAVTVSLYIVFNYENLASRAGLPTQLDIFFGGVLIILILEATRRIANPILAGLAIFALLYTAFGAYLPDTFGGHRGFSYTRIINHMYLGTEGIFGAPLMVSSTFVFLFVLFGAVLEKTGIGKFIIDLSMAIAGWSTGGPAKVCVVASGMLATVTGSSVANVCTTGNFTIPLMKNAGFRGTFAAAVEAVSSTGGQIVPPVMGAAAFIMAQFMGVSYLTVATAALIPALLYYVAVMVQVHFEAQRLGLKGLPRDRLPRAWELLRTKGYLLIPLFVIIYFLISGYTPLRAAFYSILVCIPLSYLNKETALTPKKLMEAFIVGARNGLVVACACACVGMIVGSFTLTGLALRLAAGIVDIAQGMLLPTLLMTMVACIALGTGLPTTPNFIITSTMAAPALLLLGVEPIAAYMFVFYFGLAADVTPPVALATYAAAGIAKDDPMKASFIGAKLAIAGFLVPFVFVYNPVLVLVDVQVVPLILSLITAILGIYLLAICAVGYYRGNLGILLRIFAASGAAGLLHPHVMSDVYGLAVLITIYIVQTFKAKKTPLPADDATCVPKKKE